jgi:hypothetical protein
MSLATRQHPRELPRHHPALLTPEALPRVGLSPQPKFSTSRGGSGTGGAGLHCDVVKKAVAENTPASPKRAHGALSAATFLPSVVVAAG